MKLIFDVKFDNIVYEIVTNDTKLIKDISEVFDIFCIETQIEPSIIININQLENNMYLLKYSGISLKLSRDGVIIHLIDIISEPFALLSDNRYAFYHGGCVCNDNGECIFIIAPTMSGKTTLTTMLTLNGYQYLSDDLIICDLDMNIIKYPTPIKVRNNNLWQDISLDNSFNTYKIEGDNLILTTKKKIFDRVLIPSMVLFLNRHTDNNIFMYEKLGKSESFEKLLRNSTYINDYWLHLKISKALTEKCCFYDIHYHHYKQIIEFLSNINKF